MMDVKTNAHILGESIAKLAFELQGYFVYTNSSGKAEFDMLLSKDGLAYTVEVKTVSVEKTSTKGNYFEVQLKSVRSNRTENTIHSFDNTFIDFLVIVNSSTRKVCIYKAADVHCVSSLRVYDTSFKTLEELAESA